MTYEQITVLLDKYWDGDATLDEERALKAYFSAGPVDERLRSVAPFFAALRAEQAVILERDNVRQFAPTRLVVVRWRHWAAAAAVVGMLAAAGWWWMNGPTDTFTPPVAEAPVSPAMPIPAAPENAAPERPSQQQLAQTETRPIKRTGATRRPRHDAPVPPPSAQDLAERQQAEQALAEIKAALSLVSSKLNKGKQEAAKNLHQIENMDRVFKKKSEG